MATIKKNFNKKTGELISYKLTCCVGRDALNKQIWRTKTIKRPDGLTTKKEEKEVKRIADEWEREQKDEFEKLGNVDNKARTTLADFITYHWWPDRVMNGKHTPNTIAFYEGMSEHILEYFGSKIKLIQIGGEELVRYTNYLRNTAKTKDGKPYSASTVQHHFWTLRNVVQYAMSLHYIQSDPFQDLKYDDKPHGENKDIDFLTQSEAKRFIECLDGEPIFWRCFENVLITTGMRRGECVGLQWGDIEEMWIIDENGKPKLTHKFRIQRSVSADKDSPDKIHIGATKNKKARLVPIADRVYKMLMDFKTEQDTKYGTLMPSAYIFCKADNPYSPIYPTTPTLWQSRFVKKHNLPKMSPHDLRHTAATLALASGRSDIKAIQQLLGHEQPSTTMRFYSASTEAAQQSTVDGIESMIV